MSKIARVVASSDDWDTGKLGRDETSVVRVDAEMEASLESALNLQMISVRLQKSLIDDLKFIATAHGVGYQPLMRDVLTRFAKHEKNEIIRAAIERVKLERDQAEQRRASPGKAARGRKAA
jgi:hypothetical protein